MSGIINEYLKSYLEEDSPLRASDEIEQEFKKKQEELNKLQVAMFKAREEERKAFDERLQQAKAIDQAKKAARVMNFD